MLLGGALLGYNLLIKPVIIPPPTTYDKILIYGGNIVDKVQVRNTALTEEEVFARNPLDEYPWYPDVIMFADFDYDLTAGNIKGIINPIIKWLLFRARVGDASFKQIAELDVNEFEFEDFEIKNNKQYQYRLFAQSETEISTPLDADVLNTDFDKWSLIDLVDGQVWLLDLDVQSEEQTTSSNMRVYESSFSKFAYESHSLQQYETGQISLTAGRLSTEGGFLYPEDYIDDFKAFIHNGNRKILKDRRGRGWIVGTDNATANYEDDTNIQLARLSFTYTQVAELNS